MGLPPMVLPGLRIEQESLPDNRCRVTLHFPTLGETYTADWDTPFPMARAEFWPEVTRILRAIVAFNDAHPDREGRRPWTRRKYA